MVSLESTIQDSLHESSITVVFFSCFLIRRPIACLVATWLDATYAIASNKFRKRINDNLDLIAESNCVYLLS